MMMIIEAYYLNRITISQIIDPFTVLWLAIDIALIISFIGAVMGRTAIGYDDDYVDDYVDEEFFGFMVLNHRDKFIQDYSMFAQKNRLHSMVHFKSMHPVSVFRGYTEK